MTQYREAKYVLLAVGIAGELLQGGLIFGWNSLALVIKQQRNFVSNCSPQELQDAVCSRQESKLTLIYTVGVFAVNFAPAVVGPLLDWLGPRATAVSGTLITTLGVTLLAVSRSDGVNGFVGGAFCIGFGGVAYHLAQFHASSVFPKARGLVAGSFVAGFVGSGIAFFALRAIINNLGGSQAAYRGVLLVYAALCALWVPLGLWVFPHRPLQLGQVYVITQSWRFQALTLASFSESRRSGIRRRGAPVAERVHTDDRDCFSPWPPGGKAGCEEGLEAAEATAKSAAGRAAAALRSENGVAGTAGGRKPPGGQTSGSSKFSGGMDALAGTAPDQPLVPTRFAALTSSQFAMAQRQKNSHSGAGQSGLAEGAADPRRGAASSGGSGTSSGSGSGGDRGIGSHGNVVSLRSGRAGPAARQPGEQQQAHQWRRQGKQQHQQPAADDSQQPSVQPSKLHQPAQQQMRPDALNQHSSERPQSSVPDDIHSSRHSLDCPAAAVVIPEAARFAALKGATLWEQLRSPEALGMTAFFTDSVFVLQLYLGMSRLQLLAKGDDGTYANITSVVLACGGVFIPLTHWLVDRRGYGATLATVNVLGLLCCIFQAVPSLPVQALTLASWCASRVILYSSFYAIVGAIFGFRTFGTIVGAISAITGLVGLLILPISNAVNAHWQPDSYWKLNVIQAALLLPLFGFCALIWRWERAEIVSSRFTGADDGKPGFETLERT